MDKKEPLEIPLPLRVASQTATQWVYSTLRFAIMSGQICPGRLITIRELASELNVSAMPVREAIRQLAAEHALEILENRRVRVPHMTPMKFTELFEARIALESHTGSRALPYIDTTILDDIQAIDQRIQHARIDLEYDQLITLNQEFHRAIYLANPHQVTLSLIESIWLQLGPFMRQANRNQENKHLINRHNEIIAAIKRKDAFALQVAIAADIREGFSLASQPEQLQKVINNE